MAFCKANQRLWRCVLPVAKLDCHDFAHAKSRNDTRMFQAA